MEHPRRIDNLLGISSFQEQLPWQPFRPGVDIYLLSQNPETGCRSALLRYQPGAAVPLHEHPGTEHILVLSGAQLDDQGELSAGTLAINAPGSRHQVSSPCGCIVLIIWEKPVVILPEDQRPQA